MFLSDSFKTASETGDIQTIHFSCFIEQTMTSILETGKNCWRIEHADRVRFIIDGADYFHLFREALKKAQQTVYILSWDINSRVSLVRDGTDDGYPGHLGAFLNVLAEKNPNLHIYILNWDFAMLYTLDRELLPTYQLDWKTHHRIHFHLDGYLAEGASQHQKIVVIDDAVAFIGGLDLTMGRWDTPDHRPDNPLRDRVDKKISRPYHDVMVMVDGEAARALGELVKDRWRKVAGGVSPAHNDRHTGNPWPADVTPDLKDVMAGLARTQGAYREQTEIREIRHFYEDAISSAEKHVYIENQYFTATTIGDAIQASLEQPSGPEIVVITPRNTDGWLSQHTMDVLRVRLIKRLKEHDVYHRLDVFYPDGPGLDTNPINVHAKLMIVDDRLITVGSANLNNRSMGLDSECNLIFEAGGNAGASAAIVGVRDRLMAEHLGCTPQQVRHAMEREKSLVGCIRKLNNTETRYLNRLPLHLSPDVDRLVPDTEVLDPEHPLRPDLMLRHMVPEEYQPPARMRILTWMILVGGIVGLAAMWRWTPLNEWLHMDVLSGAVTTVRAMPAAPLWVILGFVLAGFVAFPFSLLVIATVIAFGPVAGFAYSLAGGTLSAMLVYWAGDLLGRKTVRKLAGSRLNTISRRIARHGMINVIFVRIVPVAPFTLVNLVSGASHIHFRDYFLGTMLGMVPGMAAVTLIADRAYATVQDPASGNIVWLVAIVVLVTLGASILIRWLRRRSDGDESRDATGS